MRPLLITICALMFPAAAMAQSQTTDIRPHANRIKGDALLKEFLGKTHDGAYRFTEEGKPERFYTETHHENSRVSYIENGNMTSGVWMITRDTLCFQYPNDSMAGGCFRVYKIGNCFYYYDAQLPQSSNELDRDYWTARSVKKGDDADCEAIFS